MLHSICEDQKPRTSIEIAAFPIADYEYPWLSCELLALHQHLARAEAALRLTGNQRIDFEGTVSRVFNCCSDRIDCHQRQCGHIHMRVSEYGS